MHRVDGFGELRIAQHLYPAGGVAAAALHPAANNQRGHHIGKSRQNTGVARLPGERFALHRQQQRVDFGRLVSRLLTSITSGIALTSGCIPPAQSPYSR
jgi:hypothetical protein